MSLQPEKLPEVPEATARLARRLHPSGNISMWLRDELEAIYSDEQEELMETYGDWAVSAEVQ